MQPNVGQVQIHQQPPGIPQVYNTVVYGQPQPQQQQFQQQPRGMQSQLVEQNVQDTQYRNFVPLTNLGQPMEQQVQESQYKNAVPLTNLGMGSAPVDCPSCRKRCMTRVEYVIGNTTQYAA